MKFLKVMLAAYTLILIGCSSGPDLEAIKSEILNLHKTLIDDHLNKNIESLVGFYAENYIFVANGEIKKPTVEENRLLFTDYLNNTTFSDYKNLSEPIIGVSKDGKTAWSIVRVKVAGSRTLEDGSIKDFDVIFAWITVYEKQDNHWKRLIEVSTNN